MHFESHTWAMAMDICLKYILPILPVWAYFGLFTMPPLMKVVADISKRFFSDEARFDESTIEGLIVVCADFACFSLSCTTKKEKENKTRNLSHRLADQNKGRSNQTEKRS